MGGDRDKSILMCYILNPFCVNVLIYFNVFQDEKCCRVRESIGIKGNIRNWIKLNIKLKHEYITLLIFKILNILIYAYFVMLFCLFNTGRDFNFYKTFRKRPRPLVNIFCKFSLRPVLGGL